MSHDDSPVGTSKPGASALLSLRTRADENGRVGNGVARCASSLSQEESPPSPSNRSDDGPPPASVAIILGVSSSLAYFLVYFLRYPILMLPKEIAHQHLATILGKTITLQEGLSLAFQLGMGLAKPMAVAVMSSPIYFNNRLLMLSCLNILTAVVVSLPVALSHGSPGWAVLGFFLGSFPTSWVYGGMIAYFEGRTTTEAILATNTLAFVFAGSASRGAATAVAQAEIVDAAWMPALISGVVILPILFFTFVMSRAPNPSNYDKRLRAPRRGMTSAERSAFFMEFAIGISLILFSYALLTACRQFRDMFNQDIFSASNGGVMPSATFVFFVDLPGSICGAAGLFVLGRIKDNQLALQLMVILMMCYLGLGLLASAAFSAGVIGGQVFQVLLGISLYGAYCIPGSGAMFERLIASSSMGNATCTFLQFTADGSGYVFTIFVLLWKTFSSSAESSDAVLQQFTAVLWIFTLLQVACLVGAFLYFRLKLKKPARDLLVVD
eukprot:TRINITY_DN43819_c0_g1_i1.p1 TRINITY_DN43819_c0_g1~~TRINITY_DN43819_c0_g1_i1.p1  ORF type:complete len:497 (+),score=56.36 TRINITY_DN43819_c0_g1_i1:74-1564(+)